jgi:hypothetical protein
VKFVVLDTCRVNDDSIIDFQNVNSNNLNLARNISTLIIFTQYITVHLSNLGRKISVIKKDLKCRN